MPDNTEDLLSHLQARGILTPPPLPLANPPVSVQPMTPPARGILTPPPPPLANPPVSVQPMTPPANTAPAVPVAPASQVAPMKPPSIEGTAPTAPAQMSPVPQAGGVAPMVPPKIGSSAETQAELAALKDKEQNPWGSPGNHDNALGKIGHGLAKFGNIAGNIFVPNVMANIPGTDLNNRIKEGQLKGELASRTGAEEQEKNRQSEEDLRKAEIEKANEETNRFKNPLPKLLPGDENTRTDVQGNRERAYENADGSVTWKPEGANAPTTPNAATPSNTPTGEAPVAPKYTYGKPEKVVPNNQPATPEMISDHQDRIKTLTGLTPEAAKVYSQVPKNATAAQLEKRFEDAKATATLTQAEQDRKLKRDEVNNTHADAVADRKQKEVNTEIDKAQSAMKPALEKSDAKIENLQEAIGLLNNPNGEKDAIAPVKALVATAGGLGSGVRVTMPELNNIAHARGWVDSATVTLHNIFEPESYEKMSDAQRTQLKGIIGDIYGLVISKNIAAHDAYHKITNAKSIDDVRKAQSAYDEVTSSRNKEGLEEKKPAATGGPVSGQPSFADWNKQRKQGNP